MGKVCKKHGMIGNTFAEFLLLTLLKVPGKHQNPKKPKKNPMKSEVILQFLAVLGLKEIYEAKKLIIETL